MALEHSVISLLESWPVPLYFPAESQSVKPKLHYKFLHDSLDHPVPVEAVPQLFDFAVHDRPLEHLFETAVARTPFNGVFKQLLLEGFQDLPLV